MSPNTNKGKTKTVLIGQLAGPLSYYVAQYGNRPWIWEAVARACGRALGAYAKQGPTKAREWKPEACAKQEPAS